LNGHIEKLEQELSILRGKKKPNNFHLPLGQVCKISIDNEQISETMDLVEQGNKNSKSDLEFPLATDSLEFCPIITKKKTNKENTR